MSKNKGIFAVVLVIPALLVAVFFLSTSLKAQEPTTGSGLKISPTRIEMEVERGQSEASDFSLENVTNLPINATIIINDFVTDEEGTGTPRLILNEESDLADAYSIKNFVTIASEVKLIANEQAVVPFEVFIPESTNPGSYFGVIRAAALNTEEASGGTQVGLSASVGMIVLITVPGDTVELLTLKDISIHLDSGDSRSLFETGPNNVHISLNNEGNIITKPFGKVIITNWSGSTVYEYELNNAQPRGNVLPGSFRTFIDEIENVGSFGKYRVQANIAYGPSGGSVITVETSFWVIPWKAILTGLTALIAVTLFFTYGVKSYNRYIVSRSKGESHKTK